jgi:Tfp pilus assembly protein PilF
MKTVGADEAWEIAQQHHRAGRMAEAEAIYRQIIAAYPENADAFHVLGILALQTGRYPVAAALIGRAVYLRPSYAEAHSNLGLALLAQGKWELARASYERAIALRPDFVDAHHNLARALRDEGKLDESIASYRRALELQPDLGAAHLNLGITLLLRGDFEEGWREYEWRDHSPDMRNQRRTFDGVRWDGAALSGQTLFVHAEQGLGDLIQFSRFLPAAMRRAGHVVLECSPVVQRWLAGCRELGNLEMRTRDASISGTGPSFDAHAPLLSLPFLLGVKSPVDIPAPLPWSSNEHASAAWRRLIDDEAGQLKVGLAWAGEPAHWNDKQRSIPLSTFAPLVTTGDVRFFSVQLGAAAAQAASPPQKMNLVDLTGNIHDLADTAGLLTQLDLVISVDTAVAHLAGAIGKPVWTLLPFAPDFRWMLKREDSPWYPTMRLFRQSRRGDWEEVIERVGSALRQLVDSKPELRNQNGESNQNDE